MFQSPPTRLGSISKDVDTVDTMKHTGLTRIFWVNMINKRTHYPSLWSEVTKHNSLTIPIFWGESILLLQSHMDISENRILQLVGG